jgi:hypothetical protein
MPDTDHFNSTVNALKGPAAEIEEFMLLFTFMRLGLFLSVGWVEKEFRVPLPDSSKIRRHIQ